MPARTVKPPVKTVVHRVPKPPRPVTPEERTLNELKELDRLLTRMISGTEALHKRADRVTEAATGAIAGTFEGILKTMRRSLRSMQRQVAHRPETPVKRIRPVRRVAPRGRVKVA